MLKISVRLSDFKNLRARMLKSVAEQHVLAAERLRADLAKATPVDTGAARDSWSVDKTVNNVVTVRNSVPYIGALNNGHSPQAPAFFVESIALRHGRPSGVVVSEVD